jgi:hypothetical protein
LAGRFGVAWTTIMGKPSIFFWWVLVLGGGQTTPYGHKDGSATPWPMEVVRPPHGQTFNFFLFFLWVLAISHSQWPKPFIFFFIFFCYGMVRPPPWWPRGWLSHPSFFFFFFFLQFFFILNYFLKIFLIFLYSATCQPQWLTCGKPSVAKTKGAPAPPKCLKNFFF